MKFLLAITLLNSHCHYKIALIWENISFHIYLCKKLYQQTWILSAELLFYKHGAVFFSSNLNSACSLPLPGCLGISWRSSHAAGQNQPQRHSQPLRYVKLPHFQSTVGLSFSFYTLILSSATSTPEPSPVPNPAADAPSLACSHSSWYILDVPAVQTHISSISWLIFICDCHHFSPSVCLNGSSVCCSDQSAALSCSIPCFLGQQDCPQVFYIRHVKPQTESTSLHKQLTSMQLKTCHC